MEGFFEWMLEASLLAGMILVIRRVFMGKIRYGLIYALWGLVLMRFLIPVNIFATPFSIENIFSKTFSAWEMAELPKQGEGNYKAVKTELLQERGTLLTDGAERAASGKKQEGIAVTDLKKKSTKQEQEKTAVPTVTENESEKMAFTAWYQALPVIWVTVSVSLFLWLCLSNVRLLGKMKKSRIFYGKKGNVEIYAVRSIQNPCLYGFFRPAIYLPYSLVLGEGSGKASKEELEQIITHEFVHYRHRDHIWAMFRMLLVSVFWFNPFAWLSASYSKKDAELFCDETVIHLLGEENRFCYGEMLVRLAGKPGWADFRYSMMPMSRKGKEMERRIRAISGKRNYSKWVILPLMATLCMTVGITCSAGMDSVSGQNKEPVKKENDSKEQYINRFYVIPEKTESTVQKNNAAVEGNSLWQANAGESRYPYASFAWLKALQESAGVSGAVSNVLEMEDAGKEERALSALQNAGAGTPEEIFDQYMKVFTAAVNSGNIDKMSQVLAKDSDVYVQQCNLVKNYYKRGIREKVKSYSVSVGEGEDGCVEVDSKEKIKVFYADGETRIVKQQYRYICTQYAGSGGGWIIIDMQEI